jgi:DNA-binding IclR family transcriptional regulator
MGFHEAKSMTTTSVTVSAKRATKKDRHFVTALARGLEILGCFGPTDRWLANHEIAQRTRLPKPTVSRLAYTLVRLGHLRYSESLEKYALGTSAVSIGFAALGQMDVRRIARPLMQALSEHTAAGVNLGIRDRLQMVYVDTYRNASSHSIQLDSGWRIPILSTSMGRAYLCALDNARRTPLLEELKQANRADWPRLKKKLDEAFEEFERSGWCTGFGDWRREVHAISVPLLPEPGGEPMVFSVTGTAFHLTEDKIVNDVGPRLLTVVGNVRTALEGN